MMRLEPRTSAIRLAACLALAALSSTASAQGDDAIGRAMRDELARSIKELRLDRFERPYFVSYRVTEHQGLEVGASQGSLLSAEESRARTLRTDVRVGDYSFDNSNFFAIGAFAFAVGGSGELAFLRGDLPLDDNYRELRRRIWLATDRDYKQALETIAAKRAARINRARGDSLPDFSRETATRTTDEMPPASIDRAAAEALVRELSGIPELRRLNASTVNLEVTNARTRFVNSEGTSYVLSRPVVTIQATASTQARDGQPLAGSFRVIARSIDELPSRDALARAVRTLAAQLDSLRAAPVLDRYNGPVLVEGRAAAELFARVFAPALVGLRTPSDDPRMAMMLEREGGRSFTDKVGRRVLPSFLNVIDDPTAAAHGDTPLLGGYKVDDEGVAGRRKPLVEAGFLRTLLTTRTPIEGILQSSGNRRGAGAAPSNLIVEATRGMTDAALKAELLSLVRGRRLAFGVIVRELGGGGVAPDDPMSMMMAMRGGGGRAVFRAYRVYPDGREELVRGARIADVDPESFRDIVAASSTPAVYHRFTASVGSDFPMPPMFFFEEMGGGAMLPVASYVVPSLLFEDLSFARPAAEQPKPPLSPPPGMRMQ